MKYKFPDRIKNFRSAACALILAALASFMFSTANSTADEVPPNAAAQRDKGEFISLEDGKWVAGFRSFLNAVNRQMNQSGPGIYISPFDREYYANLAAVFEKNIETLVKRKKISRKKFEEYSAEFNPHIEAYARMSMVRTPIAIFLKQMSTPGLDRQRIREFFDRHRINGEDAKAFYDRIARTSRPKALELDEVKLVISVDAPREYTDFWPDRSVSLDYTLSNSEPEDAEGVQLNFLLSDPVNEDLRSSDMNCENQRTGRSGSCQSELLSEGQEKTVTLAFDLNKDRLPFRLEEKFRAIVTVEATAKSADPEYQSVRSISFTVRDCKRAYLYRLRKAKQLKLRQYQRSLRDVLKVSSGLPGRILYPHQSTVSGSTGELLSLGREAAANKGPDGFLSRQSNPDSRLTLIKKTVENLTDNLMSETRSSRICATPEGHLARLRTGLWPIRERMLEVSNMAKSARSEAGGRLNRFNEIMAKTGSGDETQTPLGSIGDGLVGKGTRLGINTSMQHLMTVLGFAKNAFLRKGVQAVGAIGLAKSSLEILVASDDLAKLNINRMDLEPLLSWIELSTYLNALDQRYKDIIEAHDDYFKEIEEAYEEACTCVEPF